MSSPGMALSAVAIGLYHVIRNSTSTESSASIKDRFRRYSFEYAVSAIWGVSLTSFDVVVDVRLEMEELSVEALLCACCCHPEGVVGMEKFSAGVTETSTEAAEPPAYTDIWFPTKSLAKLQCRKYFLSL